MEIREGTRFAFLPPDETPGALFDLGDGKATDAEEALRELGAHEDLFESISEAHYLPELGGHDEALLESLVEKGCEDNQILGRLDRLSAQLAPEAEYEEAALLGGAPVADIIGRLESLESPSRSAAQGLLHLRHLPQRRASVLDPFAQEDVYAPNLPAPSEDAQPPTAEETLGSESTAAEDMYSEQVSDLPDGFDYEYEHISPSVPASEDSTPIRTDATSSEEPPRESDRSQEEQEPESETDNTGSDENDLIMLASEIGDIGFKLGEVDLLPLKKEIPKEDEEEEAPTDLRTILNIDNEDSPPPTNEMQPAELPFLESDSLEKNYDLPKDLSMHRRASSYASPRRIEIPRAPSRESDAMQSPQPSGIPAISSPEVFNTPTSKSKQPSFLESLYAAATSPKMFTSEVTIQQCAPLNLGKHRKSASPTVTSCSDELRNTNKESGEPPDKRPRRESHDLAKICNLLKKSGENKLAEAKQKKKQSETDQLSPLKQLEHLQSNKNFTMPEHILVPRDRLNKIVAAPGKEIPALLMERPQLNLPEILQDPNFMGDPELMVISLEQLRQLIIHNVKPSEKSKKPSEIENSKELSKEKEKEAACARPTSRSTEPNKPTSSTPNRTPQPSAEQNSSSNARTTPSVGHLADDIDAANSATAYQMSWIPAYLSQLSQMEAMAACSQNTEFIKALGASGGYPGANYSNLSQMFPPSRFMNMSNIPMMPPMDIENRMQLAMWQEAVNASAAQRHKHSTTDRTTPSAADILKEAPIPPEFTNPYAHLAKSQVASKHSSRTSPLTAPYSSSPRTHPHHFMQNAYPGLGLRGPAPDIQIPFYTPPGSQRSPRASHSKSPTSPYFPNNNYLQSSKDPSRSGDRDRGNNRPRISVKSLQELQKMSLWAAGGLPPVPALASRRRDEPEVGSTTGSGEPPSPQQPQTPVPPHPHDPAAFPIWHPLFSNQKGYTSPWSWTTVTATGD